MGTPEFAVPSLRVLMQSPDIQVKGVITQPDRPAGRDRKILAPPVKLVAQEKSIPILQPNSLWNNAEALEWMTALRPDLAVVVAFGQLLACRYLRSAGAWDSKCSPFFVAEISRCCSDSTYSPSRRGNHWCQYHARRFWARFWARGCQDKSNC